MVVLYFLVRIRFPEADPLDMFYAYRNGAVERARRQREEQENKDKNVSKRKRGTGSRASRGAVEGAASAMRVPLPSSSGRVK